MAEGEEQPSPMEIDEEEEGAMGVDEDDDKDDAEPINALRPGYSERGHLVQQDTGTSGSHSPVCGSRYQPEDIQDEAEIQAELLFILFILFLFTHALTCNSLK
ncbi:hypothetical protein OS493_036474 [Desmophyllum pertusum]|uniref:Uncharacterized protein n=1 Tax=Desmophyllum pertusum TaxID=174260 RepID=A0A9W9Y7H2_9CNID|nr:hypothetical protein OS493_036474 [Desmophyllum pertusum]